MGKFVGIALLAVGLVFLVGGGCAALKWRTGAVGYENTTLAQYQGNKTEYDNFWKKVKETAQVTDQYKSDFTKLFVESIEKRYENGMGKMFAMIKEANPNLDVSVYTKLQTIIEAGRNEFNRGQKDLLDKQRAYRDHLQGNMGTVCTLFMDFPKTQHGDNAPPKDIDGDGKLTVLDYNIVLSATTNEAFKSGEADEVDVFGKKAAPAAVPAPVAPVAPTAPAPAAGQ